MDNMNNPLVRITHTLNKVYTVHLYYTVNNENDKTQSAPMEYQHDKHRVHLIVYHLV